MSVLDDAKNTTDLRHKYSDLHEDRHEVRLLTLLPGAFEDPIRTTLDNTSFDDSDLPAFAALSYTWGTAENPGKIRVGDGSLEVTSNLAQLLPYLRDIKSPRVLWIDAICINQQDLQERGSQVKRMPDIYSRATQVVVWLGLESPDSHVAMELFQDMGSKVAVDWNAYTSKPRSDYTQNEDAQRLADRSIRLSHSPLEISAIAAIMNRPWFERLWIVQEISLACNNTIVQCGKTQISWDEFSNAIFILHTHQWEQYNPVEEQIHRARILDIVTFVRIKYRPYNNFQALLEDTKNQKCSDPRDRVFAVLSIANDFEMEVDYTTSVSETYKAVQLTHLKSTRNLDVMIRHGLRQEGWQGPTWVPDLSNLPTTMPIPPHLASGESEAVYHSEGGIIELRGVFVGTVSKVALFNFNIQTRTEYTKMALEIRKVILSILPASECDWKALARTLVPNALAGNYYPQDENDPTIEETEEYIVNLLGWSGDTYVAEGMPADTPPRVKRILDYVQYFGRGRSFYITNEGHYGLGPQAIQDGDCITVLLGGNLPAVLRQIGKSQSEWYLVGEAYLDGFGNGESILGPMPDGIKTVNRLDDNIESWAYLDQATGKLEIEDPRLGPLPAAWSRKKHDEEHRWLSYVNTRTGEERGKEVGDPRLDYNELLKRGVHLEKLTLF